MRNLFRLAAVLAVPMMSVQAHADAGDLLVKGRVTYHHRSDGFTFTIDEGAGVIDAGLNDAIGAEASATMFLTDHLATEVSFGGATYNLEDELGNGIVSAGLLMTTGTLQYHFIANDANFRPYVGLGVSYLNIYGEEVEEVLINDGPNPFSTYSTGLRGGFSPVGQIGTDIAINKQLYLNVDVKYTSRRTELYIQTENRQTVARRMGSIIVSGGVGFKF